MWAAPSLRGVTLVLVCSLVLFFVFSSLTTQTESSFPQGNRSALLKAVSARAAEFKQNARKLVYGHRTSDDLAEDSRLLLNKIDVHIDVEAFRT